LGLVVLTSQRGGIADFSPDTLETRSRSERTIFGTGIPIYRSEYDTQHYRIPKFLIDEGFVTPQPNETNLWIPLFHCNESWKDGYSALHYAIGRNPERVMDWSLKNRACAELYWSEGFELLRSPHRVDRQAGEEILRRCQRMDNIVEMRQVILEIKMAGMSDWLSRDGEYQR
jgi:hypothetical protein